MHERERDIGGGKLAVIVKQFQGPVHRHFVDVFESPAGSADQRAVYVPPVDFAATGCYSPGLAARTPLAFAIACMTTLNVFKSSMSSNCSSVTSG